MIKDRSEQKNATNVDSDHAGCLDTRKSLFGFVSIACGGTISWKTCLQKMVELSTT